MKQSCFNLFRFEEKIFFLNWLNHRVPTYIEGNRENLMTTRRQLFWSTTCRENKNPLPPHLSFPTCTSIQSQRGNPQADQWPGVEGESCSVIGWMSTWGALDRSTPKNLYTLEGTLEARLSPAGWWRNCPLDFILPTNIPLVKWDAASHKHPTNIPLKNIPLR